MKTRTLLADGSIGKLEKDGTLWVVAGRCPHHHFAILAGDLHQSALRPISRSQFLSFDMLRVPREIPDEEDSLQGLDVHLDEVARTGRIQEVYMEHRLVGEKILRVPLQNLSVRYRTTIFDGSMDRLRPSR